MMMQRAFTLIELLIVITIIGLFSVGVFVNFRGAGERQAVANITEQAVGLLQQTQAEVRSGRVSVDDDFDFSDLEDLEEGETLLGDWICEGAFFELGGRLLSAEAIYDLEEEECGEAEFTDYGIQANADITNLNVGSVDVERLLVWFLPPSGEVSFFASENKGALRAYNGDAILEFGLDNDEEIFEQIQISHVTSLVTHNALNDE
jgi:prepilin-type N-terminal cleavage/methylation domain-containing protein